LAAQRRVMVPRLERTYLDRGQRLTKNYGDKVAVEVGTSPARKRPSVRARLAVG